MQPPKISEREIKDPRLLRDRVNQLFSQQFTMLEQLGSLDQKLRDGSSVWSSGKFTAEDRRLLDSLAVGSTQSSLPGQPAVAEEVTELPPTSSAIPGALVVFNNLLYRFDGPTRSWLDIGSAVPSNMMTTNTDQTPGAAVVKTWTAPQIFNGGLSSGGNITVSAGQFDSASQHGCRAFHNAAQSLNDATLTALNLDSESFDRGPLHDNATNNSRLTIPTNGDGLYLLLGQASYAANAVGIRAALVYRNGVTLEAGAQVPNAGAADSIYVNVGVIVDAAAADYFELLGYQNSGGALNTVASRTVFCGYKLC